MAAVTTQIYQAATELDLARVALQFGITETFAAGNPSDPKAVEARTVATYQSEILRTLRAITHAMQAEKEIATAQSEVSKQAVRASIQEGDEIIHQGDDGSIAVATADGEIHIIETDGSRWTQRDKNGMSYSSASDAAQGLGYYA